MMRSYPWRCGDCGKKAVFARTIPHTAWLKHDGIEHKVFVPDLPVHRCDNCGEVMFGEEADLALRAKLRDDLGLLQPEIIRSNRLALGLTQDQLGRALGHAGESVSRWERGVIQSRATDIALRTFFNIPEARKFLADRAHIEVVGDQEGTLEVTDFWHAIVYEPPSGVRMYVADVDIPDLCADELAAHCAIPRAA